MSQRSQGSSESTQLKGSKLGKSEDGPRGGGDGGITEVLGVGDESGIEDELGIDDDSEGRHMSLAKVISVDLEAMGVKRWRGTPK